MMNFIDHHSCRLFFIMAAAAMASAARCEDSIIAAKSRRQVVVIKPVIACDDDGRNPAVHALPKTELDETFAKAGIEFLFLEPVRWNNTNARTIGPDIDQTIGQGLQQRVLCQDDHVLTLLFVSSIQGKTGPQARMDHIDHRGNICIVSLNDNGNRSPGRSNATLVAERVKACLEQTNQRFTQSTLVSDRIKFLTVQEGRKLLVDESWEPYVSEATDDFLRFSIGLKTDTPIPHDNDARTEMVNQRFGETVLEFTEGEKTLVLDMIQQLETLTGKDWPLLSRFPWRFVKVDSSFCSGFPHTRGMTIVMPQRGMQRMQVNETAAISLLLHEKLHVLQRLDSQRFDALYQDYGFEKVKLAAGELKRINVAQNPDAFSLNWGVRFGGNLTSMVMVFDPKPNGELSFGIEYRRLDRQADGTVTFGEAIEMDANFRNWQQSFGMMIGLEHPNETSAYLSGSLLAVDYLSPEAAPRKPAAASVDRIEQTRKAFMTILNPDGN